MEDLRFEVVIDDNLEPGATNVVAFGQFEALDDSACIYCKEASELPDFHEDLILGRPFPLVLVTHKIETLSRLVAVALFLHRDLAIHPRMPAVVSSVGLVDRLGFAGLAHIDFDLGRFLHFLLSYLPSGLSRVEQKDRLSKAVGWIREYVVEDRLPSMPPSASPPQILDVGTNGFVVAQSDSDSLEEGWVELFRGGYLRGALSGPEVGGRRRVLIARKSAFLAFDLGKAAEVLNEVEGALGDPSGWFAGDLWLDSPRGGTQLLVSDIVKVLIRV